MSNIVTKVKNGLKRLKEIKETIKITVAALIFSYMTRPIPVYAAAEYLKPLVNLKVIFLSIVCSAGVIVLIYGIVRFAGAVQKMDQNGEYSAIFTIAAGGIMAFASGILIALGV